MTQRRRASRTLDFRAACPIRPRFLDTKLPAIVAGTGPGKRHADKLIECGHRNQTPGFVLVVHVEVQFRRENDQHLRASHWQTLNAQLLDERQPIAWQPFVSPGDGRPFVSPGRDG